MYRTQPQDNACLDQDGKGCMWPRGKMLGMPCSSIINLLSYNNSNFFKCENISAHESVTQSLVLDTNIHNIFNMW